MDMNKYFVVCITIFAFMIGLVDKVYAEVLVATCMVATEADLAKQVTDTRVGEVLNVEYEACAQRVGKSDQVFFSSEHYIIPNGFSVLSAVESKIHTLHSTGKVRITSQPEYIMASSAIQGSIVGSVAEYADTLNDKKQSALMKTSALKASSFNYVSANSHARIDWSCSGSGNLAAHGAWRYSCIEAQLLRTPTQYDFEVLLDGIEHAIENDGFEQVTDLVDRFIDRATEAEKKRTGQ